MGPGGLVVTQSTSVWLMARGTAAHSSIQTTRASALASLSPTVHATSARARTTKLENLLSSGLHCSTQGIHMACDLAANCKGLKQILDFSLQELFQMGVDLHCRIGATTLSLILTTLIA